jgi:hypothetical protein
MKRDGRRIKLKKGIQREIILQASKKIGSLKKLSQRLDIPYSTAKKYIQEIFLLPEDLFNKIIKVIQSKKEHFEIEYFPKNWGKSIGGKKGMKALEEKYPEKILEWRRKGLNSYPPINLKKIRYPNLNEKLAEFIGTYLGDGTITKYFIRISGDFRYDKPYFEHIKKLAHELFGLEATIRKEKKYNTLLITLFSKEMCSFLKNEFQINYGHKIRNNTSIPKKILENEKLCFACIRGLIDTDGSISRRGRQGTQFCIQFTSHNKILLNQVTEFMIKKGIFTFTDKTGTGTNKKEKIIKYFEKIGSSNMRHIVRFYERFYNNSTIYQKEVINYYQKRFYKELKLPFKINSGLVS